MKLDEPDLKSFLTGFTDRPGAIPPGITLKSYLSGVSFGNYYVLTKTFPDNDSTRAGMVFSHVLIIDKSYLGEIHNLQDILSLFVSEIPKDKSIQSPAYIKLSINPSNTESTTYPAYLQKTVSELIYGNTPIIFCGYLDAFEEVLIHVWRGFPIEFRSELKFRISITPNDIEGDRTLTIVYVQDELISRWQHYKIVHSDENELVPITSHSQKLLLGHTKNNPFLEFIEALNVGLSDLSKLALCDKAYNLYLDLDNLSPDSIRQLIRLVEKLSPSTNDGGQIKLEVLQRLEDSILAGKQSNLKALRNLRLDGFIKGELKLADAVSTYVGSVLRRPIELDLAIISEWIGLTAINVGRNFWWQTAMESTLKATMALDNRVVLQNVWKIIDNETASIDPIFQFIPKHKSQETVFRKYFPSTLNEYSAEVLEITAKKRKWFLLHMDCLLTHLNKVDAVKKQLVAEQNMDLSESVGTVELCERISNEELLRLTLSEQNRKLIQITGEKAAYKDWFLSKIDLSMSIWLEIWSVSLQMNKQLDFGVKDLDKKAYDIYDLLWEGTTVPSIVVKLLSESDLSDLSNYHKRREIWDKLPTDLRASFLESTAEGYIKKIVNSNSIDDKLEPQMKNRIISDDFMTSILDEYKDDMSAVIKIYGHFPDLKDQFLADYICFYRSSLSDLKSAQLGDLVKSRNFFKSANQIFEKAKYNNSYRIALDKCKSIIHLGVWDKILWGYLFGTAIDDNAAYSALTELAIKLYPQGPEENDLWKRAGGDISKLTNHNTREENWRRTINHLRYGGGGEITVFRMLKTMKEDFSNNDELNVLISHFKK